MSHYKPYLAYKDSGVEWLGQVPEHWQVKRLRFAAMLNPPIRPDLLADLACEVSFLPMEAIGEDGSLNLEQNRPVQDVRNGYSYFEDGDVAFAKVTPCFENGKGALMQGLQYAAGFGTTELTVMRPVQDVTDARHLSYIVQSTQFRTLGAAAMTGAGGLKRVPDEFTRNFPVAFPPRTERELIGDHLDRETARIDALVAKKTRFIELLREKRQALITHAVTKGLDPNVKMKDSGVEWLGEVPEHWICKKLMYWIQGYGSGTTPSKDEDYCIEGGTPWVTTGELRESLVCETDKRVTDVALREYSALKAHPEGSLVIAMYGATVGRLGLLGVPAALNQACFAIHPCREISIRMLRWWFEGFRTELIELATGAGQPNISGDKIRNLLIAAPLSLEEQEQIASHIDCKTSRLDELVRKTERSIALLKERRSALITAAVTGQIDLREAV
ncbi:restriction endonuclease subunit S [Pseudomonas sp. NW5]|uniref:restriction endonuclease subunit S n=1 Tax=Pseudomonas sp. NW5 TaxID=2934934 RepID=UPI002021901B|nr:restriction endonuclease subunit S [Pseudomonas sp. NW5]MCL7461444.1 restriction endonuclease subunit S [Pseudomonas sp. NW5]